MKKILFLLFCLSLLLPVFSQDNNSFKNGSVIKEIDFKAKQRLAWEHIDSIWKINIFSSCLNENKLKLTCDGCGNIYIIVDMKIDSAGKLVSHKKISGQMCGDDTTDKLEKCIMDYFYFIEYPPALRNKIIEVRIGKSLKC